MGKPQTRVVALLFCLLLVGGMAGPWARAAEPDGRLLILVSNDDGYDAPGIHALAEALSSVGEVIVAAPAENQSGTGHGVTSRQYISVRPVDATFGLTAYSIAARPATCVRLGLEELVPRRPDLVVSGINRGMNLGIVTFYSGTLGAAREAAFSGIPVIAVSMQGDEQADYVATAAFVKRLVKELQVEGHLTPGLFLNVNAPAGEPAGVHITRQSTVASPEIFTKTVNPRGQVYYWSDYGPYTDDDEATDVWATAHHFISITPLQFDQTASGDRGWLEPLAQELTPAPAH